MGRRSQLGQDSLELLLDTICNTFGGVLFIAMMVVILLQQTSKESAPELPPVPPEELQSQGLKLETLTRELAKRQQIRASQTVVVQGLVTQTVRDLLAQRNQLRGQQTELQAAVDQRRLENANLVVKAAQTEASNRQIVLDLDEARKKQSETQTELEAVRKSRTTDVKLPLLRTEVGKSEIAVILRYGRLYLWHHYDRNQTRRGLNTRDFVVLENSATELATRPNPVRGIPLDQSSDSVTAVRRLLQPFSPDRFYIAIVARPDSYGEFQSFRDQLLALGYQYRLLPVDEDSPVSDTGGSGSQVQ